MKPSEFLHRNCRNSIYGLSQIERFPVPDYLVPWAEPFPNYKPVQYEAPVLAGKPWANPAKGDPSFQSNWNQEDGPINRASNIGQYQIENGYPKNPFGRTGIIGRGFLGRWGPNHAADALVTRWRRGLEGNIKTDSISGRRILQMVAIQRRDNNMWAMPGGMLDDNETPQIAVKREFMEEALSGASADEVEVAFKFFDDNGKEIYAGYVDDPRNTDNAWMETTAFNFHDENGTNVEHFRFKAGDDAKNLKWIDINGNLNLYASHKEIVQIAVDQLNAHW